MKAIILLISTLIVSFGYGQVQCAIDVSINEGASFDICPNSGTTISASNGFVDYFWSGADSFSGQTITPTLMGQYIVTAIDGSGCLSKDTIIINSLASFSISSVETTDCWGAYAILSTSGGNTFLWSTGETASSIIVSPVVTTNYTVNISDGVCSDVLIQTVEPVVAEDYSIEDTFYVAPNQPQYIVGPTGFVSYVWSPTDQLIDSTGGGVVFRGTFSQTIQVQSTHATGCTLTNDIRVIVVDPTIPNGFSPNNDGINDFFEIPNLTEYEGKLTVFNRWGEIVFESKNYQNDWGGTCETDLCMGNRILPEGTYFYLLDVQGITFKGYVTIKK